MKKNMVLVTITYICSLVLMLSVACLDTEGTWPVIGCMLSGGWVALFAYANTVWDGGKRK